MSLAESLGELIPQTPKRPDAQTPRRSDAEGTEVFVANARGKISGRFDVHPSERSDAQASSRLALPLQGSAMSKHPDFVKKTLYVREATMTAAIRKYKDAHGQKKTESELVEWLLQQFAGVGGDR